MLRGKSLSLSSSSLSRSFAVAHFSNPLSLPTCNLFYKGAIVLSSTTFKTFTSPFLPLFLYWNVSFTAPRDDGHRSSISFTTQCIIPSIGSRTLLLFSSSVVLNSTFNVTPTFQSHAIPLHTWLRGLLLIVHIKQYSNPSQRPRRSWS